MSTRTDKFKMEKVRDLERKTMIEQMHNKLVCCEVCHTWQHPKLKDHKHICPKCGSDLDEN